MKTEQEINDDILKITMTIHKKFPELSKFIEEMPVTIPNSSSPELNINSLKAYYESLENLLKEYKPNHKSAPRKTYLSKNNHRLSIFPYTGL